ncbi:MAG TPA: lysylphosphatidylglycerol synthase transmembrane domain-containing protein [Bacteroidales bacterium]|jgi:hypothetical protein|nr:flippase-like domain-containing protein [Bacteroidales bacterium]MDI9573567.1 lysylphosphatidylglycerol synthase transmembrane domain-containing protein [Bacteroidota bacterium]OQC61931.1 MAG: hypothetical protein BWX51_00072 [Bacteroidetes bacterium ADurb.Bin012]MBP9511201.1 flippase-like domain-containing protein [Bacteroidales bacterium]MBP9587587.1 flippase-like domain-containing protein [Bacteroidales bacterium]
MRKKLLNIFRFLFFLSIGIFFIWIFVRNLTAQERSEIIASFRRANYFWIAISICIGLASHASRARRWVILMEPMGYKPKYSNVLMAVFVGYFANLALPRLGELGRCGVLARYEKIPFNKSLGTVITERTLDLIVFILLFILNLVLQIDLIRQYVNEKIYTPLMHSLGSVENVGLLKWAILGAFVLLIVLLIVFRKKFYRFRFVRKLKDMGKGVWDGIWSILKLNRPIEFIFHTLFIWVAYFFMSWIVFLSLPETSGLGLGAGLAVLVFGSIGIILVQGGIGVYPAIVAETLVIYGISSIIGYAMGWLLWATQTIMLIIAGLSSLILLPVKNKVSYGFRIFNTEESI